MSSSVTPLRAARVLASFALLSPLSAARPGSEGLELWQAGPELVPSAAVPAGEGGLERRTRAIELGDLAWTRGSRATRVVDLELFDSEWISLPLTYRGSERPGSSIWFGELEGSNDHLALAVQGEQLVGTLRLGSELYRVRPVEGGGHVLVELDESQFAGCGTPGHEHATPPEDPNRAPTTPPQPGRSDADSTSSTASPHTLGPVLYAGSTLEILDVLVAYTPQAKNASGGTNGILALIDLAVFETNKSYQNGNVSAAMRLVYAYEVDYNDSGDMGLDLSRFRGKNDGDMDEVHAYRTAYGADACHLLVNSGGYCGIASLMTSVSNSFKSKAFAVTARGCATGNYTFGHEFGHNFGCAHDTDNAGSSSKSYGYGYRTPNNQYRSVMAYSPGTRVPTFSSPLTTWNGKVMGTAAKEDNGRTLTENAPTIAGWYPTALGIVDCNGNGVDDGIELALGLAEDLDGDGLLDECASLFADATTVSLLFGGSQTLTLQAGSEFAGQPYLLLGSFSGSTPGIALGDVTLAIAPDAYTDLLLQTGGFPLSNLIGFLDGSGSATVTFSLPPGAGPLELLAADTVHAFVAFDAAFEPAFASNPVALDFVVF